MGARAVAPKCIFRVMGQGQHKVSLAQRAELSEEQGGGRFSAYAEEFA